MPGLIQGGDVVIGVTGDLQGLDDALGRVEGAIDTRFGKLASRAGETFDRLGFVLRDTFSDAVDSATSFQEGLANINTLGVENLEGLGEGVRAVSKEFGVDLREAVQKTYDIISNPAVAEDNAIEFLRESAIAARGGVGSLSSAIDFGTGLLANFNAAGATSTQIFDAAAIAINNGDTKMEQLGGTIGRVAPTVSGLGLDFREMLAAVSATTGAGIKTSEAVTGLKAALTNVIAPTESATKLAEQLGVEFNAQALQAQGLQAFLQGLADATGGNVSQMQQFFTSMEGFNVVMALTGGQAAAFKATLDDMHGSAGAMQSAFEKFAENNPAFEFQKAKAEVEDLKVKIGEALLPALVEVTRNILPLVQAVSALAKKHPKLFAGIVEVTAAFAALNLALPFSGLARMAVMLRGAQAGMGGLAAMTTGPAGAAPALGVLTQSTPAAIGAPGAGGIAGLAAALAGPAGLVAAATAAGVSLYVMHQTVKDFVAANDQLEASQRRLHDADQAVIDKIVELNVGYGRADLAAKSHAELLEILRSQRVKDAQAATEQKEATTDQAFAVVNAGKASAMTGVQVLALIDRNNRAREASLEASAAYRQQTAQLAETNVAQLRLKTAMEQGTEVYGTNRTAADVLRERMGLLTKEQDELKESILAGRDASELSEEETRKLKEITDAFAPSLGRLDDQLLLLENGYARQAGAMNALDPRLQRTADQYRDLAASIREAQAAAQNAGVSLGDAVGATGGGVPGFQHGGVAPGGPAFLHGDVQPELAVLPRGTRVFSPADTDRILDGGGGGTVVNAPVQFTGPVHVRSQADIEALGAEVSRRLGEAFRSAMVRKGVSPVFGV